MTRNESTQSPNFVLKSELDKDYPNWNLQAENVLDMKGKKLMTNTKVMFEYDI